MSSAETVVAGLDKLAGTRRVKQISTVATADGRTIIMYALCWDGTIWELKSGNTAWGRVADIPA